MTITHADELPLAEPKDVVRVRQRVRARMIETGFGLVDQTKLVTAASELARNALDHGGGGTALVQTLVEGGRTGVRLRVTDHGRGIPDMDLALSDGFSTVGGLGLGLGGARRLVNEFEIESEPGRGTVVTVTRWR